MGNTRYDDPMASIKEKLCHYAKYSLDALNVRAAQERLSTDDVRQCLVDMRRLNIISGIDFDGGLFKPVVSLPEYATRFAFTGERPRRGLGRSRSDRRYEVIKGLDFKCPKCKRGNLFLNRQWKFPESKRHIPHCLQCHLQKSLPKARHDVVSQHLAGRHFGPRQLLLIPEDWRCPLCHRQTSQNRRMWRMLADGSSACKACHAKLRDKGAT